MPQDGLISYGIEGNDRWRFLSEIRIGNVDERSDPATPQAMKSSCDSDLSRTLMILPVAWLKVSTLADTVPSEFETASQSGPSVPLGSTSKPKIKPPSLPRTMTSPASAFGLT